MLMLHHINDKEENTNVGTWAPSYLATLYTGNKTRQRYTGCKSMSIFLFLPMTPHFHSHNLSKGIVS